MARLTILQILREQLQRVPPLVSVDLTGKTVMVVGANTGLGFEASKHFARMDAARLILVCRSPIKGKAAVERLEQETGYRSAEFWELDLSQFSSVQEFTDKFQKDEGRLDILVQNAAMIPCAYEATEDSWESSMQVNTLSQSLLGLLLLPRMIHTAEKYSTTPRLVVVSSEVHFMVTLPQQVVDSPNILETLGSKEYWTTPEGVYPLTKLLNILFVRALSDRLSTASQHTPIIISVNPGFCYSGLRRNLTGIRSAIGWAMEKAFAHTSEEGSRQLVWGAVGETGNENRIRGAYISSSQVQEASDIVLGAEGRKLQDKFWDDMIRILVEVDPRVQNTIDQCLVTPSLD